MQTNQSPMPRWKRRGTTGRRASKSQSPGLVLLVSSATSSTGRRRKSGELTPQDFLAIRSRLHKDRAYWELVEVSEHVLRHVEELVQKTDVRALNALHIASAIMFKAASGLAIPFITSDAKQRDAAQATGLTVIWVD